MNALTQGETAISFIRGKFQKQQSKTAAAVDAMSTMPSDPLNGAATIIKVKEIIVLLMNAINGLLKRSW